MTDTGRRRWVLAALLALAAGVFIVGIDWGLPSRAVDPYLFGDRPVWTGAEIAQLAPRREASTTRGADVDVNPLGSPSPGTVLNDTDQQRAEIVRRYRLFTFQPDEMITMMSLASMRPGAGDFDPKLYQYGGLWIYPVGAMLRIAGAMGLVHLTSDTTHYLDHPEDFGRFFIVARLYTAMWGLVGVWAVFWIVRRLTSSLEAAAVASLCFMLLPVVVNMAHEAKPHLPGAVLMLLAVIAASKYADVGGTRWWMIAGALCGLAMGMVISSLPIFVILPVMVMLRAEAWGRRISHVVAAGLVGVVAYFVVNPYVAINLAANREVLRSNLSNSTAMYDIGRWGEGMWRSGQLIAEGATSLIAVVGCVAILGIVIRTVRRGRLQPLVWLLVAPAALLMLQFISLAAGKPGEYGRFALFIDVALAIGAVSWAALAMRSSVARMMFFVLLICFAAVPGLKYLYGFVRDRNPATSTRFLAADRIETLRKGGARTLGVGAEPAPYSVPPVNLFEWKIVLNPPQADVSVVAFESREAWDTDISWASKPFRLLIKDPTISEEIYELVR